MCVLSQSTKLYFCCAKTPSSGRSAHDEAKGEDQMTFIYSSTNIFLVEKVSVILIFFNLVLV